MRAAGWFTGVLWVALGCLLVSLIGVAVFLLVKMDFFSGGALNDEEVKSLWAFVGVALGAVVTLIGALLTDQHNRRTEALTREAAERESLARKAQEALDRQAEKRLSLDTVAKLLELITDADGYAKPARVGGAIATMVELEGGSVALRVLGDLWAAGAVDTGTAVWLLERVLSADRPADEQEQAAYLLFVNASKLVPAASDPEQDWNWWPSLLRDSWPSHLAPGARNTFLPLVARLLLAREPTYWKERAGNYPVMTLYFALEDEEHGHEAAYVLATFFDLGVLAELSAVPDDAQLERLRTWAEPFTPAPWFEELLGQFKPWLDGLEVTTVDQPLPAQAAGSEAPLQPQGSRAGD
jgi:hypothetical protein